MNKKEISEIRARFTPDSNNVTCIRGCYVNTNRQIVSTFNRSLITLPQEEAEKYLAIFKKTLSGVPGKNLVDIAFRAEQVMEGEVHKLLSILRQTALNDEDMANAFFERIIDSLSMECNYLILIMHDAYDVPFKAKGERGADDIADEVYSYILACVCPVKQSKPVLSYCANQNDFHTRALDWVVGAPEMGFVFPAFDDRCANIYGALYYTRDVADSHDDFISGVFGSETPMPAQAQKETFNAILESALEDECDFELVKSVNEQLIERIEETKADKEAPPVKVGGLEVKRILESCGVSEARAQAFEAQYEQEFGKAADLNAINLVETKQIEMRAPGVVIRVDAEHGDLIETRVIDGLKYILIRADEGVELNGVNISINT